ncbi:MAG: autotransporter domain-containing protein, partial [Glaciimonas sp.]|nr:autotransporter domain-containing protein [Glaciimonas sp.]
AQLGSSADAKTGLWHSIIGSIGKLSQDGYASANTTLVGDQLGVDTRLNDNTIVGGALTYSNSTANFNRFGGQSKSQNIGVSLYGRHALSVGKTPTYISGRTGVATVDSKVKRTLLVGANTDNVSTRHTDNVLSAYVETGFEKNLSDTTNLTPFAGLSYDRVKRGNFAETG